MFLIFNKWKSETIEFEGFPIYSSLLSSDTNFLMACLVALEYGSLYKEILSRIIY